MGLFEVIFLSAAPVFAVAVLVLPVRAERTAAASAVVGLLALSCGLAVTWLAVRLVSPAGLLGGTLLSAAGLHALVRRSGRASLILIALLVFAGVSMIFVKTAEDATPRPSASELTEAVAKRAEVRDFGRIRGIVWGDRGAEDMRAFAQGLEFSDLDFALAVGKRERAATLARLVERTGVPTIWVPVGKDDALAADELARDGVMVVRPAKHLILVAVDSREGLGDASHRLAIDAALATDIDPKRHVVVVMHDDPADLSQSDREWLEERVERRGVDLVITSSTTGSEARRVGEATYASIGPPRGERETLLRVEFDPRRLTLNSIQRERGERIAVANIDRAVDVIVANGASVKTTLALMLACLGVIALLLWPAARWGGGGPA